MSKRIVVTKTGGPEVMKLVEEEVGSPGHNMIKISHNSIGVNYIDTYHRSGLYPIEQSSFTPGMEAVGVVTEVGRSIKNFKEGDRVCYGNGPIGAYSTERLISPDTVFKIPNSINDDEISGSVLRLLTVWYLTRKLHKIKPDDTILFHAAAGGVGLLFCQWAKAIGASVIGTVGSYEKEVLAKNNGCEYTINYKEKDFVSEVKKVTNNTGVSVVYDGVGKTTFFKSLECLKKRGLMVSFGNASGPAPDLNVSSLGPLGSLFITRPTLLDYTNSREELTEAFDEIFNLIIDKKIKSNIGQCFDIKDTSKAHIALEGRFTIGSTIINI
jgi:NADPH2:quinone reductase